MEGLSPDGLARRLGREWYLGAMTNWTARDLEIDFSFLSAGSYEIESYEDGVNARRIGNDYVKTKRQVDKGTKLRIKLAEGGGWAARIRPKL
jgi:alpha-glucosidase